MYKTQTKHCDNINILTSKVSWVHFHHLTAFKLNHQSDFKLSQNHIFQIRNVKKSEYKTLNQDKIGATKPNEVIAETSEDSYKTPQVLIDKLLQLFYDGHFEEKIIKEQIETVIIAGNETSALTISYVILLLAMHPDIQDRVFEELRSVYDSQTEDSTYAQVQKLPYLDSVLKEGMRLFPVAPFIVRTVCADVQLSNCTVPKDAIVMMSLFNLQRNEKIWGPNADEFDPDNFLLTERVCGRHPYSFLPFSGGPRNCIGKDFWELNS